MCFLLKRSSEFTFLIHSPRDLDPKDVEIHDAMSLPMCCADVASLDWPWSCAKYIVDDVSPLGLTVREALKSGSTNIFPSIRHISNLRITPNEYLIF